GAFASTLRAFFFRATSSSQKETLVMSACSVRKTYTPSDPRAAPSSGSGALRSGNGLTTSCGSAAAPAEAAPSSPHRARAAVSAAAIQRRRARGRAAGDMADLRRRRFRARPACPGPARGSAATRDDRRVLRRRRDGEPPASPLTPSSGGYGDTDVLRLEELLDPGEAALAPETGLLDPAERCRGVRHDPLVEPHHPRLERLAHPQRAVEVTGEDVGDEPVGGVVGEGHRLVLGVERRDRRDGPEDLGAAHLGVGGDVGEHRRRVEVPGALDRLPAEAGRGTAADGVADEAVDLLDGRPVDERPDDDAVVHAAPE